MVFFVRHSINYKVMTRFPPKLVEVKAKQLVQDYVSSCLQLGVKPDPPVVNGQWLKAWQMEYRVSFRRPNRKFKMQMKVLDVRLLFFWLYVFRVRQLAFLLWGYDLDAFNLDQSPFHINEAGSQNVLTLAMRGSPTVPLKEGHAATRAR